MASKNRDNPAAPLIFEAALSMRGKCFTLDSEGSWGWGPPPEADTYWLTLLKRSHDRHRPLAPAVEDMPNGRAE